MVPYSVKTTEMSVYVCIFKSNYAFMKELMVSDAEQLFD